MKQIKLNSLVLFEDEDFVFINKPSGLATLEDRVSPINLLAIVRSQFPDAKVGHRLDKDTSGVLAIAKNPEAYRHLSLQFERRKIEKQYHAIVDGVHDFQNLLVDTPIIIGDQAPVKLGKGGKPSQTFFSTQEVFRQHTWVLCKPITGRMHQIRIHLSSLQAPIVGDHLYGGHDVYLSALKRKFNLKKGTEEQPLIHRVALHARSLQWEDFKGQKVVVEAPYPKDWKALVGQLQRNK